MNMIKKIISIIMIMAISITLFACGNNANSKSTNEKGFFGIFDNKKVSDNDAPKIDEIDLEKNIGKKKISVVYFSVNDQVKVVAEKFAENFSADLVEIIPEVPYTDEDLDLDNKNSRINKEDAFSVFYDDEEEEETYETSYMAKVATKSNTKVEKVSELPKIKKINVNNSNIIILGFPVWLDNAPKPVYTFLKGLKNKIIVPFCTDGDFGKIDEYINNYVDESCVVMTGKTFSEETTVDEINDWMRMLSVEF